MNIRESVSKRPIVLGRSDLPKFNYEDLEEIVAVGQGSFGVVFKAINLRFTVVSPLQ